MPWDIWWLWLCGAVVLAILEVLVPGYIFLGFALGAGALSLMMWIWLSASLPALLAIWAGLSAASWLVLRAVFGRPDGRARIVEDDVNK
ncbi:NfeD family protein [Roseivivax sediminis]|uniref:NfeD-like C-terminal, partner-binding n=1 Tax=Roseivivax sediminis TaxID=936889 RepID=A0A1I2CEJ9_9RHOB|nr:hypothetical protein [Roseivivax sediminis]SFE66243.1 hypothetical protein SAMN04515678_11366 [Roseivivax sediminis]